MQIILANPRGFCAGVDRAIEIVERTLELFGAPVYVRHEVVHNRFVVNGLRDKGAVFVDDLKDIPDGATAIFSAHGVAREVRTEAKQRKLQVFDATCPLVTKVHMEVVRHHRDGVEVILIGHAGHPEVEGTLGQVDSGITLVETVGDVASIKVKDPQKLAYVTQTTLSVDDATEVIDALANRFPDIAHPRRSDICYATQNRQDAIRKLARECQVVLVVGSANSSNSNRLREVAESQGARAYRVDKPGDIEPLWLEDASHVGITAGASAPEVLVQQVVEQLQKWGAELAEEQQGKAETVNFAVPRALRG